MNFVQMKEPDENRPCRESHRVNGVIPQITNIEFDGMTCECGKFKYLAQWCGCPGNNHQELKQYENENYVPANA